MGDLCAAAAAAPNSEPAGAGATALASLSGGGGGGVGGRRLRAAACRQSSWSGAAGRGLALARAAGGARLALAGQRSAQKASRPRARRHREAGACCGGAGPWRKHAVKATRTPSSLSADTGDLPPLATLSGGGRHGCRRGGRRRRGAQHRGGRRLQWNLQALAAAADSVASGGKSPVSALNELGVRVPTACCARPAPRTAPASRARARGRPRLLRLRAQQARGARRRRPRLPGGAAGPRRPRAAAAARHDFTSDEPAPAAPDQLDCLQAPPEPAPATPPPPPPDRRRCGGAGAGGLAVRRGGGGGATSRPQRAVRELLGAGVHVLFGDGTPLSAAQAPLQLSHSMRFKWCCQIKGAEVEGYGSSKKLAKLAAAPVRAGGAGGARPPPPPRPPPHPPAAAPRRPQSPSWWNEKFNELMKNDVVHSKRKVLAGIVSPRTDASRTHGWIGGDDGHQSACRPSTCPYGRALKRLPRRGPSPSPTLSLYRVTFVATRAWWQVAARALLQRHLYASAAAVRGAAGPDRPAGAQHDLEPLTGGGYQLKIKKGRSPPGGRAGAPPGWAPTFLVKNPGVGKKGAQNKTGGPRAPWAPRTPPKKNGGAHLPRRNEHHHASPTSTQRGWRAASLRTKIESGEGNHPPWRNCAGRPQTLGDGVAAGASAC
uniref:Uncharacterized protein n=1 Tax=Heliothis virescens TaxID=7102 RepID=A0A2A4J632_HELVI